ncbi:MAG: DUF697 domain-containing protein [Cyanothece sp. SIO1E1]|nr:DUF697 domain-containing protein [Cyanothece sp. SIO1E1]
MHFNRAQASLKRTIAHYTQNYAKKSRRAQGTPDSLRLQAALKADLDQLSALVDKLDQVILKVAVFGLVSRGKSAVLNALLGQKVLQTGPLHGVTQWPRSVYWSPEPTGKMATSEVKLELIDTPGLDEVNGQTRAAMAEEIAQQADLILFVVAGDITRTEYQALSQLKQAQKPLILIFNKIDLYPDQDRQSIYQSLKNLWSQMGGPDDAQLLSVNDIVRVAAAPAPLQVRVEWPDNRETYEWETPPPQIDELKQKLSEIVHREGRSLLALNVLRQSRDMEGAIASKTMALLQTEAETLIWQFAKYKSVAVAVNPIALFDLLGGAATDLVMIRSLARLYGLPMTGYEAGKLWKMILWSSGGLLLSEFGSGLLLSLSKSAAAIASIFESPAGLAAYTSTMAIQAGAAGYGTYAIGRAAQAYLEQGCTWGPRGANTIIQEILNQVESDTVLSSMQQELERLGY